MSITESRRRMFEALLTISERNTEQFFMEESADEIRVRGPCNAAVYRCEGWVSQFTRHVYSGYFEDERAKHHGDVDDRTTEDDEQKMH
jgi:hypothetical protein